MSELPDTRCRDSWPAALVARNARAWLAAAATTITVQLAVFLVPQAMAVPQRPALLAAVAFAALWTAIAAPAVASGADRPLDALTRGGTVCDASVVLLLALWALCPDVRFLTIAKIYCIYAALAMAGTSVVMLARGANSRRALAVLAAGVLAVMTATPLWACGLAESFPLGGWTTAVAVYFNPVYSIWAIDPIYYAWHQSGIMYTLSPIRSLAPPAPIWWAPVALYCFLAALATAAGLLTGRWKRPASPVTSGRTPAPPAHDG